MAAMKEWAMPAYKNPRATVKHVIDFSDIRSLQSVIEWGKYGKAYYRMGAKLILEQIQRNIDSKYLNPLRAQLQKEPPPRTPGMDIQWASDKQRKYVMWLISSGQWTGRTGSYTNSWEVVVKLDTSKRQRHVLSVYVDNTAIVTIGAPKYQGQRYARYVGGGWGKGMSKSSERRYARLQQPMHRGRWQLVYEPIRETIMAADAYGKEKMQEWLVEGLELGRR